LSAHGALSANFSSWCSSFAAGVVLGHARLVLSSREEASTNVDLDDGYPNREENTMLYWALAFLLIAIVAGALGFFGIAGTAAAIAKVLFFVFIVLFIVSLLAGRRSPV